MIKRYSFDKRTGEHVATWTIDGSTTHHVEAPYTRECVDVTVEEGRDALVSTRRWFESLPKWYRLRIWHDVPFSVRCA